MLWRLAPLLAAFVCAGCASDVGSVGSPLQPVPAQAPELKLAGNGEPGSVGFFHDDQVVRVGDSWESAKKFLPAEPTAYDLHDLPDAIPTTFEANGWETPKGEGFGVITLDGKVVLAMYQLEGAGDQTAAELLKEQEDGMKTEVPIPYVGGPVHYWFWHDASRRQSLMVCDLATSSHRSILHNVTIAVGDDNVLKKLDISEVDARREANKLAAVPGAKTPASSIPQNLIPSSNVGKSDSLNGGGGAER